MTPNEPFDDAADAQAATPAPVCPKCRGPMWDNRASKRNPRAPDFKCKDKSCDGVIWPPRGAASGAASGAGSGAGSAAGATPAGAGGAAGASDGSPSCPICGGPMWDDRATKRNPRAPDFRCKNRPRVRGGPGCEGVIWPPRDGSRRSYATPSNPTARSAPPLRPPPVYDAPPLDDADAPGFEDDDLPF
ncbi:MAG TPA: hypothetical protein VF041_18650 [Gemmatimonadaceae bacterium]